MRIVVLDGHTLNPGDNPWDDVAAQGELTVYDRTPAGQIVERARDAQIVLTNKTPLSARTLEQLPNLQFISVLATGYNVVDVAAARTRNIPVSNVPVYGTAAVAQFVFALVLELCHHVAGHSAGVKAGDWTRSPDFCYWTAPLIELAGKRMGIVGFGRIGRRVGELAHAFGMEVLASDVQPGNEPRMPPSPGAAWKTCLPGPTSSPSTAPRLPTTPDSSTRPSSSACNRTPSSSTPPGAGWSTRLTWPMR